MDDIKRAIGVFAAKMLKRMKENKHKTGWNNTDFRNHFASKLQEKVVECLSGRPESCIDAANYCMMLYKCLKLRLRRSGIPGARDSTRVVMAHKHRTA